MSGRLVARLVVAVLGLLGIIAGLRVSLSALDEPFDGSFVDDRRTVIRDRPTITATSGDRLLIGDTIIAVAGSPVDSRAELLRVLRSVAADGQPVEVDVERGAEVLRLRPIKGGFPFSLMFTQAVMGLVTLAAAVFAYLARPQPATVALLVYGYTLTVALLTWTFGRDAGNLGIVALFYVTFALSMGSILHFYLLFPEPKTLVRRFPPVNGLVYLPALAWALATFGAYAAWRQTGDRAALKLAAVMLESGGFSLYGLYLTVGLGALLHTYRTAASPVARRQIRWVFYGAAVSIVGVLVFGFIPIATGQTLLPTLDPQLGLLFEVIFPVALLFAILRYRLMDIDLVIERTLTYSILGAALSAVYLGVSQAVPFFAVRALGWDPAGLGGLNVLLGMIMAALLLPARSRVQDAVDRRFFRERYGYQQSLAVLSARIHQPQLLDQLIALLTQEATQPMHIARAWVLVRTPHGYLMPAPDSHGVPTEGTPVVADDDPLPAHLRAAPPPLLLRQDGGPALTGAEGPGLAALRQAGAAVLLPLAAAGELVGLYVLGPKQSGDIYSTEDLQWLATLAQQAAAAIHTTELQAEVLEAERRREALKRYLSPQVAEVVMSTGGNLELGGISHDVTVLFSDIRGFTTFSEQIPPEEVAHMLNQHLDAMTRAVFREGGMLDKYMGDCVMAVFGAPLAQPDHALRAVRAALGMQAAQAVLQAQWLAEGRPRLAVGIGLNSGEVIAGNFGSTERLEYTVIGDVVNTAQRIEAGAPGDEVWISADTFKLVEPWVEVELLGPRAVKGRQAAVEVYRVVGLREGEG